MRIANVDGRVKLLVAGGAVDVEVASSGHFSADPQAAYERFGELSDWAATVSGPSEEFFPETTGPPSPAPRQVFAIGLNYLDHAAESGFEAPTHPVVFPKYVSSFSGPVSEVVLPDGSVDWEVEVVAVIGRTARNVPVKRGLGVRRRSDRRPGHLGEGLATKRARASVRSGQVLFRILADGPVIGDARRAGRP